jgi:hypothetical protein
MTSINIFNDTFIVKYDEDLQSILIIHPDENVMSRPIVQIRADTLATMNFLEASKFLGERLIILIPQLRDRYSEDLTKLARDEQL